jgi:hypothetical protein
MCNGSNDQLAVNLRFREPWETTCRSTGLRSISFPPTLTIGQIVMSSASDPWGRNRGCSMAIPGRESSRPGQERGGLQRSRTSNLDQGIPREGSWLASASSTGGRIRSRFHQAPRLLHDFSVTMVLGYDCLSQPPSRYFASTAQPTTPI